MDSLHDIRGIDPIPWWPPAPGWWLLALTLLLALALLLAWWLARRRRHLRGHWQRDARRHLLALQRRLGDQPAKAVAGELSELLRRIAIARCGREHTAALTGEAWLAWLERNDASGFPWHEQGRLLLELPYAPPDHGGDRETLARLIDAALNWTGEEACHV